MRDTNMVEAVVALKQTTDLSGVAMQVACVLNQTEHRLILQ